MNSPVDCQVKEFDMCQGEYSRQLSGKRGLMYVKVSGPVDCQGE